MADRLIYVPLGGAGEIGMNMYAYGYGPVGSERYIVVDAGVTFPDMDATPGVELVLPDLGWARDRADRIDAVFLTHAHEDHIGAVPFLLEFVDAPVHARRFTAEILRRKLDSNARDASSVREVPDARKAVKAGPFQVRFLSVSHSVPEASALVLDTPAGRIIHTGDFKLDDNPVLGGRLVRKEWAKAAKGGVKALMCDSTNVFSEAPGRSESSVGPELARLMEECEGAIAATTFASNIARLKQLAEAGAASGRRVALLGRAMNRMVEAGLKTGMLSDFPETLSHEDCQSVPRRELLLLTSGSQGEARAASAQLAGGSYRGIRLARGDTFLFSSKTIPGNETSIARVINRLSENGVRVVDDSVGIYHVSGHANAPDLSELHALVNPEAVIPMHGEHRHLSAHAELARCNGFESFVVTNGQMFDLGARRHAPQCSSEPLRYYLDGTRIIHSQSGVVRDRLRMARQGHVAVSILVAGRAKREISAMAIAFGLPLAGDGSLQQEIAESVEASVRSARGKVLGDDDAIASIARNSARRTAELLVGKRPSVGVVVHRF